jgi:hypothetical protein
VSAHDPRKYGADWRPPLGWLIRCGSDYDPREGPSTSNLRQLSTKMEGRTIEQRTPGIVKADF